MFRVAGAVPRTLTASLNVASCRVTRNGEDGGPAATLRLHGANPGASIRSV
jgi:hypothetical protein